MTILLDLDLKIVGPLSAMNAVAIAVSMLVSARGYTGRVGHALALFGTSKLVLALGFILFGMRGIWPNGATVFSANFLAVLGLYGSYSSVRIVLGRPVRLRLLGVLLALLGAATWYFVFIDPDFRGVRIASGCVSSVILILLADELLLKCRQPGLARIVGGVVAVLTAIVTIVRMANWVQNPQAAFSSIPLNTTEDIYLLALFVGVSMGGVNFSLLCNDVFNAELRELASTDPLTGIANRRRLLERMTEEVSRAHRFQHSLSALLLDIDFFKSINDTYGHAVGDKVIQTVCGVFATAIRDVDTLGRLGGEEFVIILPETSLKTAEEVGERLRQLVSEAEVTNGKGEPIRFAVSIGVVQLREDEDSGALIDRADNAM